MPHFRASGEIGTNSILLNGEIELDHPLSNSVLTDASFADSSDSSTILAPRQLVVEEKRCWICFGDSSDSDGKWIKPCQCSLEAHQTCLLDWIAENQKVSPKKIVSCPQCSATYHLAQNNNILLNVLTTIDSTVNLVTPYIAILGFGCSLLITCTTYGVFTVMTLFGSREGDRLIGNPATWGWRSWVGLPMIPLVLLSSSFKWGDIILPVTAITLMKSMGTTPRNIKLSWPLSPALTIGILPWARLFYKNVYKYTQNYLINNLSIQNNKSLSENGERTIETEIMNTRGGYKDLVLSVLLWPMISSSLGGILNRSAWIRHNFPEPFQQNVLGGCLFIVTKDICTLTYKYKRVQQYRTRRVKSYQEVIKSD